MERGLIPGRCSNGDDASQLFGKDVFDFHRDQDLALHDKNTKQRVLHGFSFLCRGTLADGVNAVI